MNKEKDELPQKADSKADKLSQKVDALSQKAESAAKRPRRKKSDGSGPLELENALIGQQVHGILDGSFDAGYLLSVRVGDSTTTLRGLVFEPGLSIPLSTVNDIAPKVNAAMRDQHASLPALTRPSPVADLVAGPSSTAQLVTTVVPTHIQTSAVACQSTPLMENQPPLAEEQGQIGSGLVFPVATKQDQVGPELADPLTTTPEQVSLGPSGRLVMDVQGAELENPVTKTTAQVSGTDVQGKSPAPLLESQEQKDISADEKSSLQLQSN